MIKISSLLNAPPSPNILPPCSSLSTPPSPAYTSPATSVTPSPAPQTPRHGGGGVSSGLRQKVAKDAPVFQRSAVRGEVNYAPFEVNERPSVLSKQERQELAEQHRRFRIFPAGGEQGLIRDYVRHIPYNSEKKTFSDRTGREAFELFQYTFSYPNEPNKTYTVMWDYQIGLVRITPFFKACNFPKTQPNKVLGLNAGLRELSFSITGGAIAAQGYWMPYSCARAVCATFCWQLRWALTPIFGASFVRDCLPPNHPGFSRFVIDPDVIRVCQREAEGWRLGGKAATGSSTPDRTTPTSDVFSPVVTSDIPRSQPSIALEQSQGVRLRPRPSRPRINTKNLGSPIHYAHEDETPAVSPKSVVSPTVSWTAINSTPTPSTANPLSNKTSLPLDLQTLITPTSLTSTRVPSLSTNNNNRKRNRTSIAEVSISSTSSTSSSSSMDSGSDAEDPEYVPEHIVSDVDASDKEEESGVEMQKRKKRRVGGVREFEDKEVEAASILVGMSMGRME